MTADQLRRIETELGITLPEAYKAVMKEYPWSAYEGTSEASLWDDADPIIEQTREYRAGFGGAPPWSLEYVVIGDEDDACPYALSCATGRVIQTDHGDVRKAPLQEFEDTTHFIVELRQAYQAPVRKPWRGIR